MWYWPKERTRAGEEKAKKKKKRRRGKRVILVSVVVVVEEKEGCTNSYINYYIKNFDTIQ